MDRERGLIHRQIALDDLAVVAHQQQVADADVPEVHAERVHPEVVGQLGIARGDVPGDALVEAETTKEPERGGEVLLAVEPLLLDRAALLGYERRNISAGELLGLLDIGVGHGSTLALLNRTSRPAPPRRPTPAS